MAMEELELSGAQAQALLDSPSPLADVYRHFEKLETGYMDVIRESIEERANEMCKAKEEQRAAPVYPHSAAYASGAWGNGTVPRLPASQSCLQRSH